MEAHHKQFLDPETRDGEGPALKQLLVLGLAAGAVAQKARMSAGAATLTKAVEVYTIVLRTTRGECVVFNGGMDGEDGSYMSARKAYGAFRCLHKFEVGHSLLLLSDGEVIATHEPEAPRKKKKVPARGGTAPAEPENPESVPAFNGVVISYPFDEASCGTLPGQLAVRVDEMTDDVLVGSRSAYYQSALDVAVLRRVEALQVQLQATVVVMSSLASVKLSRLKEEEVPSTFLRRFDRGTDLLVLAVDVSGPGKKNSFHFSGVVYCKSSNVLYHADSLSNDDHDAFVCGKLLHFMEGRLSKKIVVKTLKCSSTARTLNCGPATLLNIAWILKMINADPTSDNLAATNQTGPYNEADVNIERERVRKDLFFLQKETAKRAQAETTAAG